MQRGHTEIMEYEGDIRIVGLPARALKLSYYNSDWHLFLGRASVAAANWPDEADRLEGLSEREGEHTKENGFTGFTP